MHLGDRLRAEIVEQAELSVTRSGRAAARDAPGDEQSAYGNAGLSAEMAIRFEKAFGLRAEILMRMQSAHELAQARMHEDQFEVERMTA